MKFDFWKMQGALNDFVLFDDRDGTFPVNNREFIAHIASRRSGIGSEGVILIQKSERSDFTMRFFNPDGGEVEMCGNGARCVALLAFDLGVAGRKTTFDTVAGPVRAKVMADQVCLWLPPPTGWILGGQLELDGQPFCYHFVNSGVPHVVVRTEHVKAVDVQGIGSALRYHENFAPAGTNVDFVEVLPNGELSVRTYERGVEQETLACGTGVTACGLIAAQNGWVTLPVSVHTASGDVLAVDAERSGADVSCVTLTGPAGHVFSGTVEYSPIK